MGDDIEKFNIKETEIHIEKGGLLDENVRSLQNIIKNI